MPILNSNQRKTIQDVIDDSVNGKIKYEDAEKELSKLLPEGSEPFKFDRGSSENLSADDKSSLTMKNFTKFKETAPDYTPPSEDFNAFKARVEELSAPAAPANETPRNPESSTATREQTRSEPQTRHPREPEHEEEDQELKYIKENNPQFYDRIMSMPEEMRADATAAFWENQKAILRDKGGYNDLHPGENPNNFDGPTKRAGIISRTLHDMQERKRRRMINEAADREVAAKQDALKANQIVRDSAKRRIGNGLSEATSEYATELAGQERNINAYNKACRAKISNFEGLSDEDKVKAVNKLKENDQGFKTIHDGVVRGYAKLAGLTKKAQSHSVEAKDKNFKDFDNDIEGFNNLSKEKLPEPEAKTPDIEKQKSVFEKFAESFQKLVENVIKLFTKGPSSIEKEKEVQNQKPKEKMASGPSGPGG